MRRKEIRGGEDAVGVDDVVVVGVDVVGDVVDVVDVVDVADVDDSLYMGVVFSSFCRLCICCWSICCFKCCFRVIDVSLRASYVLRISFRDVERDSDNSVLLLDQQLVLFSNNDNNEG